MSKALTLKTLFRLWQAFIALLLILLTACGGFHIEDLDPTQNPTGTGEPRIPGRLALKLDGLTYNLSTENSEYNPSTKTWRIHSAAGDLICTGGGATSHFTLNLDQGTYTNIKEVSYQISEKLIVMNSQDGTMRCRHQPID